MRAGLSSSRGPRRSTQGRSSQGRSSQGRSTQGRSTQGRSSRGAAAVEAALIVPLLVLLFFGVLEFGLLFRNSHTINNASRSGARVGSALPRAADYQDAVAEAVAASIRGNLPSGSVDRLVIYKADATTGEPVDGTFTSCSTCWKYDWDGPTESWVLADLVAQWPAADQSACGSLADTDYLGVYVEGRYSWATGLFGADKTLTEKTVMRLEPLPSTTVCAP